MLFACADTPPERESRTAPTDRSALDSGAAALYPDADAAAAPGAGAPTGPWTVGRLEGPPDTGSAVLAAVRTGQQDGYDRVVLEFAGGLLPGYRAAYVDSPQQQCGSGDDMYVTGSAWIRVDLEPARAHDDEGRATVADRAPRPDLPNLVALRLICDFEGQVTWLLGLRSTQPFRILRLGQPARLVLDIRH